MATFIATKTKKERVSFQTDGKCRAHHRTGPRAEF